jgi:hypothetical protein
MKEASSWGCEEKEDHKQKTLGPHPDFKNSHCFCLAYFLTIKEIPIFLYWLSVCNFLKK